ncbi:NinI-like serine-threonine phosphatase [Paraconexibacter sp. AEG42_29]|uniref:NinI-like serine-threonine phosphatase n=1 Tax=Paraconexibacter sp. AEG42_29 TaxID=2997339 RepID=A0AAU7AT97_9ACTN
MLAVLYDLHGNIPALDAVLEDAQAAGADRYLLGGDYAGFGAWPRETVRRLEALPDATWIAGNHERWLGGDRHDAPPGPLVGPATEAQQAALDSDVTARLSGLPPTARIGDTLFCHASPHSDMASFGPNPEPEDRERLGTLDAGVARVVFGHTHVQLRRRGPEGVELVNPGSVGLPFDGDPRAAYARIADDGTVTLHRVDYDRSIVIAALEDRGEQWATIVAGWLRTARFAL